MCLKCLLIELLLHAYDDTCMRAHIYMSLSASNKMKHITPPPPCYFLNWKVVYQMHCFWEFETQNELFDIRLSVNNLLLCAFHAICAQRYDAKKRSERKAEVRSAKEEERFAKSEQLREKELREYKTLFQVCVMCTF